MNRTSLAWTAVTLLGLAPACSSSQQSSTLLPEPSNAGTFSAGGSSSDAAAGVGGTSMGGGGNLNGGDACSAGLAGSGGGSASSGASGASASAEAGAVGNGGGAAGASAGGAGGTSSTKVEHRFVSGMSDGGPVALVAADGHIEWQYDLSGEANDAWRLTNGDIVFAYKTGARELTPDRQVVWSYEAPAGSEIHSCQPLPNGFLLGEAHDGGVGYLREVDGSGKVQKTVTINVGDGLGAAQPISRGSERRRRHLFGHVLGPRQSARGRR